jgi:hypothetical protein
VLDKNGFRVVDTGGVTHLKIAAPGFSRPLFLQLELIGPTEAYVLDTLPESFSLPSMPFMWRYSVMKVAVNYLSGFCVENGFSLKLNEHVVIHNEADVNDFRAKFGYAGSRDSHGRFRQPLIYPEGIVLVPLSGTVRGAYSTTRYAKITPTVDKLDSDGVVREYAREQVGDRYRWSLTAVCDRADKSVGNPPSVANALLAVPELSAVFTELARNCDWDIDWQFLPGLNKDTMLLPLDNTVPASVWLALYTMRSTIPVIGNDFSLARTVQEWLRTKMAQIADDSLQRETTVVNYEQLKLPPGVNSTFYVPDDDESGVDVFPDAAVAKSVIRRRTYPRKPIRY